METTHTPQDVAKALKVDVEIILNHIRSGKLEAANVGLGIIRPRWRITAESLDAFLAARRSGGPRSTRRRKSPATAATEFFK